MADTSNLYDELKTTLNDFKTFLDQNTATIGPAIKALKTVVPQITDLLNKLIDLMNKLLTTIQGLNPNAIPGLADATKFTTQVKTFLQTAKGLLPDEASAIDQVLQAADVVGGLPSLDAVKAEIVALLQAIIHDLTTLNA